MGAHTFIPKEAEAGASWVQASLGYTVRPSQ